MTDTSIPRADQSLDEEETAPLAVDGVGLEDDDIEDDRAATEAAAERPARRRPRGRERPVPAERDRRRLRRGPARHPRLRRRHRRAGRPAGRPVVEVVGGRLQNLVGQRGATLEALQELARLAVFRQTGTPSRLLLDVGGYRANRRKELGRRRQERGREGQGVRRAGAAGADVRVRAQVRARRGQRASPAWRASPRASSRTGASSSGRRTDRVTHDDTTAGAVTGPGGTPPGPSAVRPGDPAEAAAVAGRRGAPAELAAAAAPSSVTGSRWPPRTPNCWRPTAWSAA